MTKPAAELSGALSGVPEVIVVGEALIELVHTGDGVTEHPGGSPVNVAYGLARLDVSTGFLTSIGTDDRGLAISSHLAGAGVHILPRSQSVAATRTATATLAGDGSATYSFDLLWQLAPFAPTYLPGLLHAGSIASFLAAGVTRGKSLLQHCAGISIVTYDPNIRPELLGSQHEARTIFEDLVPPTDVVKLSDEDGAWLYPRRSPEEAARHIRGFGTDLVVVTRRSEGSFPAHRRVGNQCHLHGNRCRGHHRCRGCLRGGHHPGASEQRRRGLRSAPFSNRSPAWHPWQPPSPWAARERTHLPEPKCWKAWSADHKPPLPAPTPRPTCRPPKIQALPLPNPEPETSTPPMTAVTTHPETFRPALHYTARNTWLNDPNGLIHHQGLYHLYYQNNPLGNTWGNMSWGHATSENLADWTEQHVAIACDEQEDIFSGSIVFDSQNSSGFGTETAPPLVAIYTSAYKEASPLHGTQAQSLAYSLDGGFIWKKYAGNPVLSRNSANFRDPKVFRYDGGAGSYWVMAAVEAEDYKVVLYKSEDLKSWEHLSDFGPANATGGIWECPDLFALPVDGNPEELKWVLTVNLNPGGPNGGSAGQYFTGDFDGITFASDSTISSGDQDPDRLQEYNWLDWGRDYYAAVSFSDAPDGRRIMIGWMNNWDYANQIPTSPWRSPMSLPRELSLTTIGGRTRLVQNVVEEAVCRDEPPAVQAGPIHLDGETRPIPAATGTVQLIEVEFTAGTAEEFGLIVRGNGTEGTRIGINPAQGRLILDRTASGDTGFHDGFPSVDTAPIKTRDGRYTLKIYVDHCSVEVFAQHGELVLTDLIFPDKTSNGVSIYAHGGSATLKSLTIAPLA